MSEKQAPELFFDVAGELKMLESAMLSVRSDHGEVTGFCDAAETIDRQLKFTLRETIVNARRLRSRIELEKQENSENG